MSTEPREFEDGLLWMADGPEGLTIGVTQNALDQAGALQGIDLADPGDEFEEGDWIAEIRGKDATVDVRAPCSLRVLEINRELHEQPGLLEDDPTGDAWMLRAERL